MIKNVLIIGANSKIAYELSKIMSMNDYNLFLLSKNFLDLKEKSNYLKKISKSKIEFNEFDITAIHSFDEVLKKFSKTEILILASGFLDVKNRDNLKTIEINYTGPKNFLEKVISSNNNFEEIICFTSVSGDRVDANLNEYSNSKKKLSEYILKNKNRFKEKNIFLKDLKLGYVKTKMTNHIFLQNIVCCPPEKVAKHIFKNIGIKNDNVIYYPKFWIQILKIYNFFKKIHLYFK